MKYAHLRPEMKQNAAQVLDRPPLNAETNPLGPRKRRL
jgi:hypothetical protein